MGAVSGHSGSSDDVSNATDRALLAHIRSISDVIVTTAATARAEHLRPSKFAPMVVLTQSGELHGLESLLSSTSELKPIVVVPSHQLAKARDQLLQAGQNAEVVGLLDLSPNQVIDFLNDQGFVKILLEGGPKLLASWTGNEAIDELCLTTTGLSTQPLSPGETELFSLLGIVKPKLQSDIFFDSISTRFQQFDLRPN